MMRRSFLAYAVGMLSAVGVAQSDDHKTVMEKGKAVVCEGSTFKCGACGKDSCSTINAPMVIGNENRNYPEPAVLFQYRFVVCDNCGVLSAVAG